MYSALYEIFEKLDVKLDERNINANSFPSFTHAFYGAPDIVEGNLIPELIRLSSQLAFRLDVYKLYKDSVLEEQRRNEEGLAESPNDVTAKLLYSLTAESLLPKLAVSSFEEILAFYDAKLVRHSCDVEIYDSAYRQINGVSNIEFVERTYPWYWVGAFLYARRKFGADRRRFLEQAISKKVAQEYAEIGIDLAALDSQFYKYRILSLAPDHEIQNYKDSQTIVDRRIKKHFWLNVPRRLLFALEDLRERECYIKIAFNIKAVTDNIPILEEMERGAKLKIDVANMPDISKFYSSDDYDDNLWVVHDRSKNSLTFEELRSDFESVEDKVVTQVVHLEYKIEEGKTLITHLDHELIVYTLDEYIARQGDSSIKGSAGKIKSFKIDEAKIPFDFKHEGDWFLLIVLDAYFLNHALIQEFFEDLLKD